MDVVRWIFEEVETSETHTVEINPNEATNHRFGRELAVAPLPRVRVFQTNRQPLDWTFSGVVRSQSHHDALIEWQKKPGKVRVTDHLGRTFEVMMRGIEMLDRRPAGDDTWRLRYTFSCMLLRRIP